MEALNKPTNRHKDLGPAGVCNVRTRRILPSRCCHLWLRQTEVRVAATWLLSSLNSFSLYCPRSPVIVKALATWNKFCISIQPAPAVFDPSHPSPFPSSCFRRSRWKAWNQSRCPCRNVAWCDVLKLLLQQMVWPGGVQRGSVVHTQLWIPGKDKIPWEEQAHHITLQSHMQGLCAAVRNSGLFLCTM